MILLASPQLRSRLRLHLLRGIWHVLRVTSGGRGIGRVVRALAAIPGDAGHVRARLRNGCRLTVPLDDEYWVPVLLRGGRYEPEVETLLDQVLDPSVAFVDCGANIGWWSLLAATRWGCRTVIAVEPAPNAFDRLRSNAALNGNRIVCIQAAVWSRHGDVVALAADNRRHAWASAAPGIRDQLADAGFEVHGVPTVTVDGLVERHVRGPASRVVIKLDVEGGESEAVTGGRNTLHDGALLIYEDHGRDREASASAALFDAGLAVFALHEEGPIGPLGSLSEIQRLKTARHHGYNFAACRPGTGFHARLRAVQQQGGSVAP